MDATPAVEKELQQELGKVARQYGGGPGVDMTKFPEFKFEGTVIFSHIVVQYEAKQSEFSRAS